VDADETEVPEVPSAEPEPAPVSYAQAERHTFGLAPNALVAALATFALGAALALLLTGQLVVGLVLLAVGVVLGAFFVEQARRRRASAFDRAVADGIDNSRALSRFAVVSMRAWSSAGGRTARSRLDVRRLRRERSHVQHALGAAAFAADDEALVETLRDRMRELDVQIEACFEEARSAVARARSRTTRERLAVAPTEIRPPGDTR
jgi:hypothetical protein